MRYSQRFSSNYDLPATFSYVHDEAIRKFFWWFFSLADETAEAINTQIEEVLKEVKETPRKQIS